MTGWECEYCGHDEYYLDVKNNGRIEFYQYKCQKCDNLIENFQKDRQSTLKEIEEWLKCNN